MSIPFPVRPGRRRRSTSRTGVRRVVLVALAVMAALAIAGGANAGGDGRGAATVALRRTPAGWELIRDGKPYFIRGAGGDGSKPLLARMGGNSIRTWGDDGLQGKLDEALRLNMTVAVGIWLGHERHGFKYSDPAQVARQFEAVRATILRYKDHPAVLLWGLGNEMEGYGRGDNVAIWTAVNDLAKLAKELDPNHPTMTVVAEIGGDRVRNVHRLCPDVDIIGINSYAGASSLPRRYREAGGTKPYILTEFGPPGPWEAGKTAWGAAIEPSSSEKAIAYRRSYLKAVTEAPGLCLGSYAFLWGHKQETTPTWFGMLLPDGHRLGAADALAASWSGDPPANRCPSIKGLKLESRAEVEPGAVIRATLSASDPEGDRLTVRWILQGDPASHKTGGDAEDTPPTFPEAIVESGVQEARVRLPASGGGYRLYAYVFDEHDGAAVANIPLYVKGPVTAPKSAPARRP
jgi:hypothetical protein